MKRTMKYLIIIALCGWIGLAVNVDMLTLGQAKAALPPQTATATHTLELVGQIGGSFKAITVQDNYAYVALGPRLVALDMSDATQPTLTGKTDVLLVDIQALSTQDNYVYAAAGDDGLLIFDIANPSQPGFVSSLDVPGFATGIVVTGTHAYLTVVTDTHTGSGLQIVDVSQPETPQAVGTYAGNVSDIAFEGDVMYLALGDRLNILDITNPITPTLIAEHIAPADDVEIDGNLAYVGKVSSVTGGGGPIYYGILRILNISDPANIIEVFSSGDEYPGSVPSQLRDMKLLDNKLYGYSTDCSHATGPCDLEFGGVDVSDPISPTLDYIPLYYTTRYDWYWGDFTVAGQQVYMATKDVLHVYDANTNTEQGQYTSWLAEKVTVANDVAYVAARSAGLLAIDVSSPTHPTVMDVYTTTTEGGGAQPAWISDPVGYGPYVYAKVTASGYGMSRVDILDVSNSTDIQQVNTTDWWLIPEKIHQGYGYYLSEDQGYQLKNIDLGLPTQPTEVGGTATGYNTTDLVFFGGYAYLPNKYQGLQIVDISNPQAIYEVQRLDGPIPGILAESGDQTLYISTDEALKIYDLADPTNPVEISSTPHAGLDNVDSQQDMKLSNDYLYLAQTAPYPTTIRVFQITESPVATSEVISYTLSGSAVQSIDVVGDLVYIASSNNGLLILRHSVSNPALSERVYLPIINQQSYSPTDCGITYRSYLQDHWLDWVSDSGESGAAGEGTPIEALDIQLCNVSPENMSIVYQTHVQDIGWMDWVYEGQIAGTIGEGKQIEAVRFKLLNAPDGYQIVYRVYVQGSGWTEPVSDGEIAGTTGQGKQIEAIQIELLQP
ncbi:MAG: hypothetical protein GY796_12410 [Chloroflexi bacterium]|nr:hypothetical protein [Chloroflexota bacterium]